MKIERHDFVEVNYTGKLEGKVFDTTLESVAKEHDIKAKSNFKPTTVCVGENQLLLGLDNALVGKEIGEEFTITLQPEEAFGKRDIKKIKMVPSSTFKEHKVEPRPGLQIDVDGEMGIVSRVSGGRIIVNFNHPLAGKVVEYTATVVKKVEDSKEQLTSFLNTVLRIPKEKISIELKEGKALVKLPFELPPQFTEALSKKLNDLTKIEVSFGK